MDLPVADRPWSLWCRLEYKQSNHAWYITNQLLFCM